MVEKIAAIFGFLGTAILAASVDSRIQCLGFICYLISNVSFIRYLIHCKPPSRWLVTLYVIYTALAIYGIVIRV